MKRVIGVGPSYQERLRQWLQFPECSMELVAGYLMIHGQVQHIVGQGYQGRLQPPPPLWGGPYLSGFCPSGADVPKVTSGGIPGGATIRNNLGVHVVHHHMQEYIVILE